MGGPYREPGGVRRLNRRAGRGREALIGSLDGLGGHPGCVGGVGRPSRRDGTGWEALEEGWVGSGGQGEVGRPSCSTGMGRESLPEGWECREGSRGMGGVRRPPWRVGRSWVGRP